MIKTIFFDIGGVLIDIHPEKTYQYISDCVDLSPDIIEKKFPWEAHNEYEKGYISDRDWFMAVKEALPQPCCLKESDFWKGWKLLLGEEKKTLSILQKLKSNYNIWLLSNTNSKHIQDEIEINYLLLIATFLSFMFSFFTIKYFLKFINKISFNIFILYRIILGLILFLIIYT